MFTTLLWKNIIKIIYSEHIKTDANTIDSQLTAFMETSWINEWLNNIHWL